MTICDFTKTRTKPSKDHTSSAIKLSNDSTAPPVALDEIVEMKTGPSQIAHENDSKTETEPSTVQGARAGVVMVIMRMNKMFGVVLVCLRQRGRTFGRDCSAL